MFEIYAMPIEKPSNGQYLCKKITALKNKFIGVELYQEGLEIINALMMPSDEKYFEFINEKVDVSFREEIVDGISCLYINNFTKLAVVATIPKDEIFRFYLDKPANIDTDIIFDDIQINETVKLAKVYCIKHSYESSKKTFWSELRIMDRNRKIAVGRLFKPDNREAIFQGRYLIVEMTKTKFGFTIDSISPRTTEAEAINPIVPIAKSYIHKIVSGLDEYVSAFITQTNFINFLEKRLPDENLEIGFDLVRIALSLCLAEPYKNITNNINYKLIQEALILREAYLLLNDRDKYNNDIKNTLALAKYASLGSENIIHLVTSSSKKVMLEHVILDSIVDISYKLLLAPNNENIL